MNPEPKTETYSGLHINLLFYSILVVVMTGVALLQKQIFWLAICSFVAFMLWVSRYFITHKELSFPYGPANAITLLRFFGLITISIMHPSLSLFTTGFVLTVICLSDILDGYIARALNMSSIIGEYMDKEADALFVLLACFILFQRGFTGPWILSLGLIRYIYFIAVFFFLKPDQKEHKDPQARWIATIVFIGILSCFFVPYRFSFPVLAGAGILLAYSFIKSTLIATGWIRIPQA